MHLGCEGCNERDKGRCRGGDERNEPLVIAVIAHEVYGREIKMTAARRALRVMEHARMVRVRERLDLLELRLRLEAVRVDELFVLHPKHQHTNNAIVMTMTHRLNLFPRLVDP